MPGAGDTAVNDRATALINPHSRNASASDDSVKGRRWLGVGGEAVEEKFGKDKEQKMKTVRD